MSRESIFKEIDAERSYQDERWGKDTDDTVNTPWMWTAYIALYSSKWMAGTLMPLKRDVVSAFRTMMIKTASIAIAAVESIDRQRSENGRCFYEEEDQ